MRFIFKRMRRLLFWALLLLVLWVYANRPPETPEIPPQALEPETTTQVPSEPETLTLTTPPPRPFLPENLRADHVIVNKSARRLQLMKDGELVKQYEVALGFSPEGHKTREGDGKTPVGEYVLDWRNDQSDFHLSMHISYPTPEQKAKARAEGRKPGGAIMIHGQPNNAPLSGYQKIKSDWTAGCIAVSNAEMDEIWKHVRNGTKITIIE